MKNLMIAVILISGILPAATAEQEALITALEQSLVAPCCWSGTVYDHGHAQMEKEIRQYVENGKTRQEIMDIYVAQYGERILASPKASGFNLMAWFAPILIALAGIAVFANYLRAPKKATVKSTPGQQQENVPHDDQIERELKQLD